MIAFRSHDFTIIWANSPEVSLPVEKIGHLENIVDVLIYINTCQKS